MVAREVDSMLLLSWPVAPVMEEPWRRFLQELGNSRAEEHAESRRLRGVNAELVWFLPRPAPNLYGGGIVVFHLESQDPVRALAELATSNAPFDRWYRRKLLDLCGFDLSRPPRGSRGELLFAWQETPGTP